MHCHRNPLFLFCGSQAEVSEEDFYGFLEHRTHLVLIARPFRCSEADVNGNVFLKCPRNVIDAIVFWLNEARVGSPCGGTRKDPRSPLSDLVLLAYVSQVSHSHVMLQR